MTFQEMFGLAIWLGSGREDPAEMLILRGKFTVKGVRKAVLRVLGLGYFHCYVNGTRVGNDLFLPLNTDFEPRANCPVGEALSGHRIYVPEYDVTDLLGDGVNTIAIHFGGGWYTANHQWSEQFGMPKAIWRIFGEQDEGTFDIGSSERDRIGKSYVYEYNVTTCEKHDYRICTDDVLTPAYDDGAWEQAAVAVAPQTEYLFTDCPTDRVCQVITPVYNVQSGVYDCGVNTTGYPVLILHGQSGDEVKVTFSEELSADGTLDARFGHWQQLHYVCDGRAVTVRPLFTWFGFRYFSVQGKAEVQGVEVVHASVAQNADFKSDHDTLNWIHDTFVNTQLTNMHGGIPSDCPHIERRGYTGDGQLICHAAMNLLDAKRFYRKWIEDIRDCQDTLTGHVQYTAPYYHSGGGPGGWGSAIVTVPYEYYMQYGEIDVLSACYPQMLRYFDYLDAHSDRNLIVSDKEGDWCLGDWCPPIQVILPTPFVNNYFYVKSLARCIGIASLIGKQDDISMLEGRMQKAKQAMTTAYYNPADGNFIGNVQGANAFAVDIGIGDARTYQNLVNHYRAMSDFDTGIFGTDIVTRVLFEHGDGDVAVRLLTGKGVHSFAEMQKRGATTLGEYWPDSLEDRSHNHPMFGAVVGYFYDYLLGIRQLSAGYEKVVISPVIVPEINVLSGYRTLPGGKVAVSYQKTQDHIDFTIEIPKGLDATFVYGSEQIKLDCGTHRLHFDLPKQ